jgi:hypothetical protein
MVFKNERVNAVNTVNTVNACSIVKLIHHNEIISY